jgi:acetate kinase
MNILVINAGSSSIKFDVIELSEGKHSVRFKGLVEGVGEAESKIRWKAGNRKLAPTIVQAANHTEGLRAAMTHINDALAAGGEFLPDAIGHRVVHGGLFVDSALIDSTLEKTLEDYSRLAPLHNPPNLMGIRACKNLFPTTPMVAVFDTAFHAQMPQVARTYPLPKQLTAEHQIYRYGFHGTSHRYVSREAARLIGRPLEELKLITCHLGNGASLAAVKNGRSIDTTMGFTPLEGLMMGTRTGDIDAGVVLFLIEKLQITPKEVNALLNKKSGLLGVSGLSNDMRMLEEAADNPDAQFALELFAYRVKRQIGAMAAALNGADALIFTAVIGENDDIIRRMVLTDMDYLGVTLDESRNAGRKSEPTVISTASSRTQAWVIPTDEELMIAQDTARVVSKTKNQTNG